MREKVRPVFRKEQSELSPARAKMSCLTASGSGQYKQGTETMFTWLSDSPEKIGIFSRMDRRIPASEVSTRVDSCRRPSASHGSPRTINY